jgi:hypothetical protein
MNHQRVVWLVLCTGLCAFVVVITVLVLVPKHTALRDLQRMRAGLEAENQRIRAEIGTLINKQERFATDPRFVERTAHESGRIKTNETVFLFPPD